MPSAFHAIFGTCRNEGGTKRKCYVEAVRALGGKPKRKPKRRKKKSRR